MSAMPVGEDEQKLTDALKKAMRGLASSVAIVTSRDGQGQPHGMAASAVVPVSMSPPSMLVAVNRDAGLHPVLQQSGRYCINLLAHTQNHLLAPFSQSALRDQRFYSEDWCDAWDSAAETLPWLTQACASIDCVVEQAVDYGSHTLFIGRVQGVRCDPAAPPLVWLAGRPARLSQDN